ncbi:MAG: hypothetical protein KGL17_05955 [Betaproteobacteria bacterium]|nr:hypothetical protein [Betaproteobacteria bacterium]
MATVLTVITPFAGYAKGQRIDDGAAVAEILASEAAPNVVATTVPDAPAPLKAQPEADAAAPTPAAAPAPAAPKSA